MHRLLFFCLGSCIVSFVFIPILGRFIVTYHHQLSDEKEDLSGLKGSQTGVADKANTNINVERLYQTEYEDTISNKDPAGLQFDHADGSEIPVEIKRRKREITHQTNMQAKMTELEEMIKYLQRNVADLQKFVSGIQQSQHLQNTNLQKPKRRKERKTLCPTGSVNYGRECLLYQLHRPMNWVDARDECAKMAGRLVTVKSKRKRCKIGQFLQANLGDRGMQNISIYTGLIWTTPDSKLPYYTGHGSVGSGKSNGWYWVRLASSNIPFHDPEWQEKTKLDINSSYVVPSCMFLNGSQLRWEVTHCNQLMFFICEFILPSKKGRRKGSTEFC